MKGERMTLQPERMKREEYVARWRSNANYLLRVLVRSTVAVWGLIGMTVYGVQSGWGWPNTPLWAFLIITACLLVLLLGSITLWTFDHARRSASYRHVYEEEYREPWILIGGAPRLGGDDGGAQSDG